MHREDREPVKTIESLYALKRRIYLWAMAAGLLAQLLSWIPKALDGTISPYERIIFPVITVLCVALLIAIWLTQRAVLWAELSLFAIMTTSMLGRLWEILQSPITASAPDHLAALADLLYWFPLVYVLAFLIFDNRRQLLIGSLLFFITSVAVGLGHTIPQMLRGDTADIQVLSRFYLANAAYIILLMVGARLNEQYVRARTLAETMTRLAHTDSLVQIANRRELEDTMAREIKQAARYFQSLSVVLFDLDHFKHVNDNYGHEAGDDVLKEIALVAQGVLRLSDQLGRWGGEEFLVVASQTNASQACRAAERLRIAIAHHQFEKVGNITASFGVTEYRAGELPQTWLKRVDEAMYAAKQAGRNCVVMK
jgi:diguanylate cyclase (GGDEF)-like protein